MHNESHCRVEDLRDLMEGRIAAVEESVLIHHLDECDECRQTLDLLSGGEPWVKETRDVLRSLTVTEEYPYRTAADLDSGDGYEIHGPDIHDGTELPRVMLQCLAPTDDPAMLGRLGTYEIAGVVGCGGAGIVFKALDRPLNRFVAVKVLSPILACNGAARKRFAREAKAAAAVVHEHIVPIYAVDEFLGLPFLVMQYVPGRSLQQRLNQQGPAGIREILRIGHQAALGLTAAHAQGVVHRDIKPANILMENGVERVLLTDFGLARTVDDASLTCSGVIAGTPEYMSPEQARGEAIDHRSDLFSLGSVLYALCTGHSPFRAATTMGILQRICNDKPRSIREVNPEIPEALCELIDCLLDKRVNRRPQSATEVAEWCAARLAELQTARPLARRQRSWLMARLPWVAVAAVILGGVASVPWWWKTDNPESAAKGAATSDTANVSAANTGQTASRAEETGAAPRPKATGPEVFDWGISEQSINETAAIVQRLERELTPSRPSHPDIYTMEVQEIQRRLQSLEESFSAGDSRRPNN
jgi:serine/threonine-protein kinase